jgi:circadian clock protein KaiC
VSGSVDKIPTAVPGLDRLTQGGLPVGRSVLIVGKAGSGKTILGLQAAVSFVRQGVPTIFLCVEESPADMVETGDALGFDVSGAVTSGKLRLSDATRPMDGPLVVSGEYDLSGLVHRVEALVKATGARAIVLDFRDRALQPAASPGDRAQPVLPARARLPQAGADGRSSWPRPRPERAPSPPSASRTTSATW